MTFDPYAVLGVERDATPEEVRQAYRRKAQDAHPDKGGAEGAFPPLQRAYALLKDARRRSSWDQTGRDPGAEPEADARRAEAIRRVVGLFLSAVLNDQLDPDTHDLVHLVRDLVADQGVALNNTMVEMRKQIRKCQRAIKRVRVTKGKENLLTGALEANINQLKMGLERAEDERKVMDLMRDIICSYGWDLSDADVDMLAALSEQLRITMR